MNHTDLKPYCKAALVADSLSLGSHWIYNQSKLARTYPEGIHALDAPLSNYHPDKKAGDFTHYGDQAFWLHESISNYGAYTLDNWQQHWTKNISSYTGYVDGASKSTLATSSPSTSNDLAGASRLAPILDLELDLDTTISHARSQTQLTHGDTDVIESAEFFVRAVFAIKQGSSFAEAFKIAADTGSYQSLNPQSHIDSANRAHAENPNNHLAVATKLGLTCHFPEAFPLTLYYALYHGQDFSHCLSQNSLSGGDNSARAMLLAPLFVARDGDSIESIQHLAQNLNLAESSSSPQPQEFKPGSNAVTIDSPNGKLAGIIEIPDSGAGEISACAIFAHCFTCGKDYLPEKKITQALAANGIATLRVDFSGLGSSGGAFEDSSFLTNVEDIYAAAEWLRQNYLAPSLLVGHSLGGTAVLAAASNIPEIQAISTIGSPADPSHIRHLIESHIPEIEQNGKAEVSLAGRKFIIGKQFLEDLKKYDHIDNLKNLKGHKLIMHSPIDSTVELSNAGEIYSNLKHPKSFIALADADHLLTTNEDAKFAAQMISTWAKKVIRSK